MEKVNINKSIDYFIFVLLCGILIIDSINGFLLRTLNIEIHLSQLYKIFLQILLLIRLLSFNNQKFLIAILIFIPLLFSFIINVLLYYSDYLLVESIIVFDKFYFSVISFLYFTEMINRQGEIFISKLKKVLSINLLILVLNILIGMLGYGHQQYRGNIGTRGFFYAGNEMSALIIVLFSFSLFLIYYENKKKNYYIFSLIYLTLAVFSSTKVAIVGILLSIVIIPKLNSISNTSILKINLKNAFKTFLFISLSGVLMIIIISRTGILERWSFFYNNKFSESFFSFLLSGRNIEAKEMLNGFFNEYGPLRNLVGIGAGNSEIIRIVEMDFVDIIVNYGFIGLITIYTFLILIFISIYKKSKNTDYNYAVFSLFICLLLFPISTFTGHIIFSAMAGVFISMISSLAFFNVNKKIA